MIRPRAISYLVVSLAWIAVATSCQTAKPAPDPGLETGERATAPAPAAGRYHEVKPGETVWGIADRYGLTIEELTEVNGLASANEIAAGQLLFIPADAPGLDAPAPKPKETKVAAKAPARPSAPITDEAPLMWPVAGGVLLRDF